MPLPRRIDLPYEATAEGAEVAAASSLPVVAGLKGEGGDFHRAALPVEVRDAIGGRRSRRGG